MTARLGDKLKYKRSLRDPLKFDINEFLYRVDGDNGKRRGCQKKVPWSRERVASHVKATCTAASDNDKAYFKGLQQQKRERKEANRVAIVQVPTANSKASVDTPAPSPTKRPKQRQIRNAAVTTWADTLTDGECAQISEALADFVFRAGIPFRVIESAAMKDLLHALRSAYVPFAPSVKKGSGSLMTKRHASLFARGMAFVAAGISYTLSSDGWSDINGEHMVNYVVLIPEMKPFLVCTKSTIGVSQTSDVIAADTLEVIYLLGVEKCVAVVADNAPAMRGPWQFIEQKHPHIFASGCAAHVVNLLINDVCSISDFAKILKKASTAVSFIRDHGFVASVFKNLRKQLKVKEGLKLTVPTRWYSQYNQCYSLLFVKYAVFSLLESGYEPILSAIKNQDGVTEFREIAGDTEFWAELHKLKGVLSFPSKIIGKLEGDSDDLFKVYDYLRRPETTWTITPDLGTQLSADLLAIVRKRWKVLSTDSVAFAYMLTPKSSIRTWRVKEKLRTKNKLKLYIEQIYSGDKDTITKCKAELEKFLTMMFYLDSEAKGF